MMSSLIIALVGVGWPPNFQSYEDFKAELESAVAEHPPFGEWLRERRNIITLYDHDGELSKAMQQDRWFSQWMREHRDLPWHGSQTSDYWRASVDILKEMYLKDAIPQNIMMNSKRLFVEQYLKEHEEEYEEAENMHAAKQQAYEKALTTYTQVERYGYGKYTNVPPKPAIDGALKERQILLRYLPANITANDTTHEHP